MAQQTTARGAAGKATAGAAGKEARDAAARTVNGMNGMSGMNGIGGNGARPAKPRTVARADPGAARTRADHTEPGTGSSGAVLVKGAVAPIPVRSSSARTAARIPPVGELKLGWQERASCQQAEAAAFFAPDSERIREREKREAAAKRVCEACPVRSACLEHALAVPEQFGIWGGMTELERQEEARRRRGAAAGSRPVVLPIRLAAPRDLGSDAARGGSEVAA